MAAKSNLVNMVAVLGASCLFCSAVLGGAYVITKEPIAAAAVEKTNKAVSEVLPAFDATELMVSSEGAKYYRATLSGELAGYAIESVSSGFGGPLSLLVGITPDGIVYNTSVLSHSETPGLGAKCTTDARFMSQWKNFDPRGKRFSAGAGGDIDAITASTITSNAYAKAVENAVLAYSSIVSEDASSETEQCPAGSRSNAEEAAEGETVNDNK